MKKSTVLSGVAGIVILAILAFWLIGPQQSKEIKLFNGKDLNNWGFVLSDNAASAAKVFTVKDGVIHVTGSLGYMYTKEQYGNYKLHVEWRWPEEATNSGIFLLMTALNNPFPKGVECQLQVNNAGDLIGVAPGIQAKQNPSNEKPVGEWNTADIEVIAGHIRVSINGLFQNEGTLQGGTSGNIGLQSEGKAIEFRNVYVIPLPE
ncbi:MAG: DUF1080 domain-containing protein [Prevotellaceae bacterium]|jgi:hypothetical protein|nr:DUF1080 domain-containing protein [Prevotellaceae bacterium]